MIRENLDQLATWLGASALLSVAGWLVIPFWREHPRFALSAVIFGVMGAAIAITLAGPRWALLALFVACYAGPNIAILVSRPETADRLLKRAMDALHKRGDGDGA